MKDWSKLFEQYVKASYRYYELYEETGMSDFQFDMLCKELADHYDEWEHPDKGLADVEALRCGTGYQMMYNFPEWAKK